MAKRRRRKTSNPKRRRRTTKRRRRSNPGALMMNPKRRRRSRRRNPAGLKDTLGELTSIALPATVGGAAIGFVDSKFLGTSGFLIRTAGKVAVALGIGHFGKKMFGEVGSKVAMGAVLSTIGHEVGVKFGGGMVAMNKAEGVNALIEAAAEDEQVAALIEAAEEGYDDGNMGSDFNELEDAIIQMESDAAYAQELGDVDDYEMIAEAEGYG